MNEGMSGNGMEWKGREGMPPSLLPFYSIPTTTIAVMVVIVVLMVCLPLNSTFFVLE
jgi:hypothetical protein